MDNSVQEFEKQQNEAINKSREVYTRLENAYKESEGLIDAINVKRAELKAARKRLWTSGIIMTLIVAGLAVLQNYL